MKVCPTHGHDWQWLGWLPLQADDFGVEEVLAVQVCSCLRLRVFLALQCEAVHKYLEGAAVVVIEEDDAAAFLSQVWRQIRFVETPPWELPTARNLAQRLIFAARVCGLGAFADRKE